MLRMMPDHVVNFCLYASERILTISKIGLNVMRASPSDTYDASSSGFKQQEVNGLQAYPGVDTHTKHVLDQETPNEHPSSLGYKY